MNTTINLSNTSYEKTLTYTNHVSFHIKEVTITNTYNNEKIYAKIYIPDIDGKKLPAIVLSHGYNGCGDDFETECTYFAQHGYVAVAYDFCGGSTKSRSSMPTTKMTIFTEKSDLISVFNFVKNLDYTDNSKIFLLGGSQGGFVTALAAEELSNQVSGMILYYPAFCIPDDWRQNLKEFKQLPHELDFWNMKLGQDYFESVLKINTFDEIGSFPNNVLILHGNRDAIVPLKYSNKAINLYSKAHLYVIEDEEHGFSPKGVDFAKKTVINFTNKI
ncbi:alpha/beta hydrolase family protein [Lachnobacterium bovis]|uniref:Acetyl xylan esterase domain-containing protein n=1 Tax=Lachnobacterium bovis TaxID=140626 RepID=A0A1H9SN66_9FIRM|nr:alpha/beta fold hydrolase [Lachnobacterium bovis]SER85813.1 hypothetical protein SAMN02910429_01264 [Lachnobacterium bovis]